MKEIPGFSFLFPLVLLLVPPLLLFHSDILTELFWRFVLGVVMGRYLIVWIRPFPGLGIESIVCIHTN